MSGRSFLCDLWFSQTLRHKNYIYIYIYIFQVKIFLITWDMGRWNLRLTEHKLRHMHHIYIYIWCICLNLCSVKRKFQRPISQVIKKIFTWNFEGGLIDHQSCFTQNLKFLAVQEPAFLKSKFGQNRPLTGF